MRSSSIVSAATALLFSAPLALAAALVGRDPAPVRLRPNVVSHYKRFTYYSAAAYCSPDVLSQWTCGADCEDLPNFTPFAAGGDGNAIQNWYVGYDATLKSVIVGHQGTDPTQLLSVLTDLNLFRTSLPAADYPNIPADVEVHSGFLAEHAKTASQILAAVNASLAHFETNNVAITGHSLGGALALLEATYLRVTMPDINIKVVTYGMPRVGNAAYAAWVDANIPDLTRITHHIDPIPIVPGRSLGFAHPHGEIHIQSDESTWAACTGQDNTSPGCEIHDTPNVIFANLLDHLGPYDGVMMGLCSLNGLNGKRELPLVDAAMARA